MKIVSILASICCLLVACSSEPGAGEHPGPSGAEEPTTPIPTIGADTPELVGKVAQPLLTGCSSPFGRHTLSSPVMLFHTLPPANCPNAWYTNFDVTNWKLNSLDNITPTVPGGVCTFTYATRVQDCVTLQNFTCTNGIAYSVRIDALQTNYATATIRITGSEPGCQRQVQGRFDMTGIL